MSVFIEIGRVEKKNRSGGAYEYNMFEAKR